MQGLALMPTDQERIAVLETKLEQITRTLEHISDRLDELHETWQKAKGAKWVLLGLFGVAAFLGTKLSVIATWLFEPK